MGDLWGRFASVIVGNLEITCDQLDIEFTIKGSNASDKNTADIVLFNLSKTTRGKLKTGLATTLKAGYRDDYGILFSGTVQRIYEERDGGDLKTHVIAATAGYATGRSARKYLKGTALSQIINQAFGDSGIPVQKINDQGAVLESDYTSETNAGDDLAYCKKLIDNKGGKGAKYYVEANGGYFVAADYARDEQVVISKETGLKETVPEDPDDKSYSRSITCILNYRVITDSRILLESLDNGASGAYKVVEYTHASEGSDTWQTEMKVI